MGQNTVSADVAGVRFAVETAEPWAAAVASTYAGFPSDAADARIVAVPDPEAAPRPTGPATVERRGPVWSLATPGLFDMEIDIARGTGKIRFAAGPTPTKAAPAVGLLSALKAFVVSRLVEHGGLVIHACAVAVEGRGALCVGPSGAGKSTLAAMFDAPAVLSDELVAVTCGQLHATPFLGTSELSTQRQSVPLGHGFSLRQAETCSAERMNSDEGFRALAPCIALPQGDTELEKLAFVAAQSLAATTPWSRLSTTLESDAVVSVLTRRLSGVA